MSEASGPNRISRLYKELAGDRDHPRAGSPRSYLEPIKVLAVRGQENLLRCIRRSDIFPVLSPRGMLEYIQNSEGARAL